MPLHKYPVYLWQKLRLRQGIYARLPAHFLRSLEEERTPTPVHYRPHGVKFKINPKNGLRELRTYPFQFTTLQCPSKGCGVERA